MMLTVAMGADEFGPCWKVACRMHGEIVEDDIDHAASFVRQHVHSDEDVRAASEIIDTLLMTWAWRYAEDGRSTCDAAIGTVDLLHHARRKA